MASLESLNDSQRAVLQLLLRQGKSYDDLAGLLGTTSSGVRARALEAVEALGPANAGVGPDRRREIADYLLGQQGASQRAATREYLEGSADGRAWARATAVALWPVAGEGALPDIPAERAEVAATVDGLEQRTAPQQEIPRSSQLGAKLIAGGLGLVIAIIIIVVAKPFSSDDGGTTPDATSTGATPPAATSTATNARALTTPSGERLVLLARGDLRPPRGSGATATGQVAILLLRDSSRHRLGLQATGLPPSSTQGSAYGVWFYTSPGKAQFLGFPDTVVGPDGKLETVADLDPMTPTYREVLLTRERSERPTRPGTIILQGRLLTVIELQQQLDRRRSTRTTP